MSLPPAAAKISYEKLAIERLLLELADLPDLQIYRGQALGNRFSPPEWQLRPAQGFQFGDLRFEAPTATIVIEFESAGGITNLVKYWPLLTARPLSKRLVLLHLFQIASSGDYIAHRRLWQFLLERMQDDLRQRGPAYVANWEAQLLTYHKGGFATEAATLIRTIRTASA